MSQWTFADIPDQSGRIAIVTGANTGIGLETARMLAQKGADVVLACRNPEKGQKALDSILADKPKGHASVEALDLSDLDSVAAFARAFAKKHEKLDLLVNNAGVMVPPLGRTTQGFELQFGTNHLGHFALTARLLPLLEKTKGARIVVVSSTASNMGKIDFDDLNWEQRSYSAWKAYCQSKLANTMTMLELSRRLEARGSSVRVTAAHPGWTATDLQRTQGWVQFLNPIFAMKPHDGALPTLRAATDPNAESASYWGPANFFELNGPPVAAKIPGRAKKSDEAKRLFEVSEKLTGVSFEKTRSEKVPDAKVPDAKVPEVKVPDVKVPDAKVPDLKVPDLKVPDLKVPDVKVPGEKMPDVKAPSANVAGEKMATQPTATGANATSPASATASSGTAGSAPR